MTAFVVLGVVFTGELSTRGRGVERFSMGRTVYL